MPVSLHSALVPTWIRILNSSLGWLDKAEAFAKDNGISEAEMMELRLIEDMLPFNYQIKSMCVHSLGAIEGVRAGSFSPDSTTPPEGFAALKQRVSETIEKLSAVDETEMEGLVGQTTAFVAGQMRIEFLSENFLLHFSQSNFHFHSTTAYAILRMKGVQLGKRDFMGSLPVKG